MYLIPCGMIGLSLLYPGCCHFGPVLLKPEIYTRTTRVWTTRRRRRMKKRSAPRPRVRPPARARKNKQDTKTHRITSSMTQMHAPIPKSNTRKRRRQQHLRPRLPIAFIFCHPRQKLDRLPQSPEGEDVGDGVGALVCRAVYGIGRTRGAGCVWDGCV